MLSANNYRQRYGARDNTIQYRSFWQTIHIDIFLLLGILLLMGLGVIILYQRQ